MGFDNFHVIAGIQNPGNVGHHFEHQVNPDAHIRGQDDSGIFCQLFYFIYLGGGKTGGADDHGFARRGRLFEMLQGDLGMGKIDEHIAGVKDFLEAAGDLNIFFGQADNLTHILAHGRVPGFFKSRGQNNILGPFQHMNNAAAHAPGRTSNNHLDHRAPVSAARAVRDSAPTIFPKRVNLILPNRNSPAPAAAFLHWQPTYGRAAAALRR